MIIIILSLFGFHRIFPSIDRSIFQWILYIFGKDSFTFIGFRYIGIMNIFWNVREWVSCGTVNFYFITLFWFNPKPCLDPKEKSKFPCNCSNDGQTFTMRYSIPRMYVCFSTIKLQPTYVHNQIWDRRSLYDCMHSDREN